MHNDKYHRAEPAQKCFLQWKNQYMASEAAVMVKIKVSSHVFYVYADQTETKWFEQKKTEPL